MQMKKLKMLKMNMYALSGSGYIKVNRNLSIRINALVL